MKTRPRFRPPVAAALLWLTLLALPVAASAQIVFTVQATANSTALGYTSGQAATFTFALNGFASATPNGNATGSSYSWVEEALSHPEIWTSVGGTGLGGTWARPSATAGAPYSELVVFTDSSLELFASHDTGATGLSVDGGGVQTVKFYVSCTGLTFSNFTTTLPNPASYFSDYTGTYTASSTWDARVVDDSNASVSFTVDSLTISAAAVSEPSSSAVFASLGALGAIGWQRRRRAVAR